jgi:hypothetical protein
MILFLENDPGRFGVVDVLIQQSFAFGYADTGYRISYHIESRHKHLNGAVNGQDQGVSQQRSFIDKTYA